jgi:signal transduction histidine kinase
MRVVTKFAFAFFAVSFVALIGYAYVVAEREAADLRTNAAADLVALGSGLREAVALTWAEDGRDKAQRILGATQSVRRDVSITWGPAAGADDVVESRDGEVIVTLPVRTPDGAGGALILRRSLARTGEILRSELRDQLVVALALAGSGVFIVFTLGSVVVGGPLERIVAQARRIGAGDLSQRLKSTGRDEIGMLKRELNRMCDQLAAARDELEAEATARVETLEQLRHLDRLRTAGMLASSVAHELGTPLNVLLLKGQSLSAGELQGEDATRAGKSIVAQVEKMSRIVRQLLDFTRKRSPAQLRLGLREVAERASGLLGSLAMKHGVRIETRIDEDVSIIGDPEQLEQALTNLMTNGIHAMRDGGALQVRVRTKEDDHAPGAARGAATGLVEVSDGGVGMDAEALARVFEPFYTTKPRGEGTGLGLSVACGIAEDHGGWISATSEPGKGSTFTLHLPRAA